MKERERERESGSEWKSGLCGGVNQLKTSDSTKCELLKGFTFEEPSPLFAS